MFPLRERRRIAAYLDCCEWDFDAFGSPVALRIGNETIPMRYVGYSSPREKRVVLLALEDDRHGTVEDVCRRIAEGTDVYLEQAADGRETAS